MAPNWRQVLVVDAVVGLIVIAAGLVIGVLISFDAGAVVTLGGLAYLSGGLLRWRRWARLRAAAGLDDSGREGPTS